MSDEQAQAVDVLDPRLAELAGQMHDDPLRDPEPDPRQPGDPPVISENTRWLSAEHEPRYCWRCGKPLQDQQAMLPAGYNVLTGERLPDERHITKVCPMHATWVQQPDGSWVRP